ncbi:unnamed protein product [Ceutorhynchus assimilis]|uniref:Aldehyde dehydrogenase domain-containing protein n=1 Tax=Ceutorhynchus assimilis TaxID=467358 RepID=A0A9N9MPU5_9CUCU|nr:unnamed protein product [Ceutorhynchus assimilis]
MSIPPLPRPKVSNGISSKINQLYSQQPEEPLKITKQQQNELNKKLKQSQNNGVPKKLLIDPNPKLENLGQKFDKSPRELNLDNSVKEAVVNIEIAEMKGRKSVKECVTIARKAFSNGRSRSLAFRQTQLKGLLKFLENHKVEIEEALHKDLRKHKQETNTSEIEFVANDLRYTLIELKKWIGPEKPKKRIINSLDGVYVYNDPYGVVLIMGAWNYPILLTLGPLVGALAGGNVVIMKPSELAPATNKLLAEVLTNYLDQECFQVHQGGVQETTELLKQRFDYIFFTGSSKIGHIVYQAAAKHLTPCTLELGGKCPLYIDDTVNMQKTAKRVLWGRMLNSGQTCVAPDYLLCTKQVQELFLKEAEKIINKFWGDDPTKSPYLSKIVTENHFKRLVEFIKGEQISLGGQVNSKELIIGPTILTNVNPHSPIMEEEIFGPILPILNVKDAQEAIDFINSREKPLASYVFSNNKKTQNLFLKQTSSGGVSINDTISHIMTENLPFGGVGQSGLGNYHGKYGFDTFTHKKGVLVKDFSAISEMALSLRYPPYSDQKTQIINTILKKRKSLLKFEWLISISIFLLGMGLALVLQYYFNFI